MAVVRALATAHEADHPLGRFQSLAQSGQALSKFGVVKEGVNINGSRVFAEHRTIAHTSERVAHIHIFESGGRNDALQTLFAEVFPVGALRDAPNIDKVGHPKTTHEFDEPIEPTVAVPGSVNLLV
jgi:hypothetical protein